MLQIQIPETEYYDAQKQEFVTLKAQELVMEHSLISISKWESKWKKPFLETVNKTMEETIDYFRCMTITSNVNPIVYNWLPMDAYTKIRDYIDDTMTATWFKEKPKSGKGVGSSITSEVIYYWMVMFGIPFECEKWHLNRLLTLIRVCEVKQTPSKKSNKKDILANNYALNARRRRELGTRG